MSSTPAGLSFLTFSGTLDNTIGHACDLLVHKEDGQPEFRAWLCQCGRFFKTDEELDEHRSGREGEAAAEDLSGALASGLAGWADDIRRRAAQWAFDEVAAQVEAQERVSSIGDFVEAEPLVAWARNRALEAMTEGIPDEVGRRAPGWGRA